MIYINFQNESYRYDLRELVATFYPQETIQMKDQRELMDHGELEIAIEHRSLQFARIKIFKGQEALLSHEFHYTSDEYSKVVPNYDKQILKRELYCVLSRFTRKELPWGILTGIRPSKVVRNYIELGLSSDEIEKILRMIYKFHTDKIKLILQVCNIQEKIIYPLDDDKYSLYINIPFCPTVCDYCSFPTLVYNSKLQTADKYVEVLIEELHLIADLMQNKRLRSIYVGGGTPTVLSERQLETVLSSIIKFFKLDYLEEFTVEAGRPDTIHTGKLDVLKKFGVDRISINPQTFNQQTLYRIKRNHTIENVIETFDLVKSYNFKTINMDIILGLPGETFKDIDNTLTQITKLRPENLTVHTLSIKNGSKFKENLNLSYEEYSDLIEKAVEYTYQYAQSQNLLPYYLYRQKHMLGNQENIGYCLDGHECIYNISMMEETETIIAAGMSAVSKVYYSKNNRFVRIPNYRNMREYIEQKDIIFKRKRDRL